jgi:aminoglycoside 6'-N-acetyltransferase
VFVALRGERVVLRPATLPDAERLLEILSAPGVIDWWWMDATIERCRTILTDSDVHPFMVELEAVVVGFIQYAEEPDPDYRHASIDVSLHPDWHGQGLGTDAVRTLARYLVHDVGHHRLTIDPAAANPRAIRCYEKVGFKPVGIMREYERSADGTWHDGLLMDLLDGELS